MLATLLLSVSAAADFEIDAKTLAEAEREARAAVEAALGVDLSQGPRVVLSTVDEVEEVLSAENVETFRNQIEDPEQADAERERFARLMSAAVLAKYSWSADEVMVVAGHFEDMAEELDEPELHSPEALRALLVHELVHAVDDYRFDYSSRLTSMSAADHILCLEAVMEGNAQRVARDVAQEREWSSGFDAFTRSITAIPGVEDMDPLERYMAEMSVVRFGTSYHDGERFVRAVLEGGGAEALERAFREPPTSTEILFHPEWFLDPSLRPELVYDLPGALASVDERFEEGWNSFSMEINSAQLSQALAMLPEDDVRRCTSAVRSAQTRVHVPDEGAQNGEMVVLVLMETPSFSEASFLFKAEERLIHLKDSMFEGGPLELKDKRQGHDRVEETQVFWCEKRIGLRGEDDEDDLVAMAVVMMRGSLVLEVNRIGTDLELEELLTLGHTMLASALAPPAEEEESDEEGAGD